MPKYDLEERVEKKIVWNPRAATNSTSSASTVKPQVSNIEIPTADMNFEIRAQLDHIIKELGELKQRPTAQNDPDEHRTSLISSAAIEKLTTMLDKLASATNRLVSQTRLPDHPLSLADYEKKVSIKNHHVSFSNTIVEKQGEEDSNEMKGDQMLHIGRLIDPHNDTLHTANFLAPNNMSFSRNPYASTRPRSRGQSKTRILEESEEFELMPGWSSQM